MKKISILLILTLFTFAVSCSSPNKPEDNNSNNNNISISERAGNYTGIIFVNMKLDMQLDNKATLTSLRINGVESVDPQNPIKVSDDPNSKETVFGPFNAKIKIGTEPGEARVRITFNSATDKTQGAKAEIDLTKEGPFNPTINSDLTYVQ